MRTCNDCNYVKGNECIQYAGPTSAACGLVTGAWYTVNDLISALVCVAGSGPGNGGCDNCICLMIQGNNNTSYWGSNGTAILSYKIYADPAHTTLVLARSLVQGSADNYIVKGSLPYSKVYPTISVTFEKSDPSVPYYTGGYGVDMILVAGGLIRYARSIAWPAEGEFIFADIPTDLPTGTISLYLLGSQFDTNDGIGKGVVAAGGDELTSSLFQLQVTLVDGGRVDRPTLSWPVLDNPGADFDYTNFDTQVYSSVATSMTIAISGTNNESFPVNVSFQASVDSSLSFSELVAPNGIYQKIVPITFTQAENNDFLIRFLKSV